MKLDDKKRQFILGYLDNQIVEVNLKTVSTLINYGKNNSYSAPEILQELTTMDQKHEGILTVSLDLDYVDGVKLFNNGADHWLTELGQKYFQDLKDQGNRLESNISKKDSSQEYEGYLTQVLSLKDQMLTEKDQVTLQEFSIDLRHLLNDNKRLEQGALSKFKPFVDRNWGELSTPTTSILVELSRRFLFENRSDA